MTLASSRSIFSLFKMLRCKVYKRIFTFQTIKSSWQRLNGEENQEQIECLSGICGWVAVESCIFCLFFFYSFRWFSSTTHKNVLAFSQHVQSSFCCVCSTSNLSKVTIKLNKRKRIKKNLADILKYLDSIQFRIAKSFNMSMISLYV